MSRKNCSAKWMSLKIIKGREGFTLGEALVAVIILLLATSIVVAGIPAAIRAYDNVVVASNAEVLLSTTMSALRNELSTAKDITTSSEADKKTEIIYYNQASKTLSKIYVGNDGASNDNIMYQIKASNGTTGSRRLISKEASDSKMKLHVTYSSVDYDHNNGLVTFSGLKVWKGTVDNTVAEVEQTGGEFTVRVISDHSAELED